MYNWTTSQAGKEFIMEREKFSPVPYLCPAKVPTIGFGTTRYTNGMGVTLEDRGITREEGEKLFSETLVKYERAVNESVKTDLTRGEFDALVSLAYNIGAEAFRLSTLAKISREPGGKDIKLRMADQFLRWNKVAGVAVEGLTNRRRLERARFLGGRKDA